MRTLLIDNYDSYTFNLFQLLAEVNQEEPLVVRNDTHTWAELTQHPIDNIVISPGPGHPGVDRDFGVCADAIRQTSVPLLGVCLGHQGLAQVYGGTVSHAPRQMHGRTSLIKHNGNGLFAGLPQDFVAVRYHSLCVLNVPQRLEATAWADDGVVMALRHRTHPRFGLQFHPESICTEHGRALLINFREISCAHRRGSPHTPNSKAATPAPPQPSRYALTKRELKQFIEPEAAFMELYARAPLAFWLDSSRAERPLSRFSYMGDASGPLSAGVEYALQRNELTVRQGDTTKTLSQDIFSYLGDQLAARRCDRDDLPFDFCSGFVGYLGYELKGLCGAPAPLASEWPDAQLIFADRLVVFDHQERTVYLVALTPRADPEAARAWFDETADRLEVLGSMPPMPPMPPPTPPMTPALPPSQDVTFQLRQSREEYLESIRRAQQLIADGHTYEVCLTNELSTPVAPEPLLLYRLLRRTNPAPYAAYLRFGDRVVLSCSPERYLKIDREGRIEAKPIKGTAARSAHAGLDAEQAERLRHSEKDRAENLMIVDLLRNDLGSVSEVGSVAVPTLMQIETYETVHQLVSTITGQLRHDRDVIDCIRASFPGGSMTGAPKLRTMEIIDALERRPRGVYSGTIAALGVNGTADMNIVIRTVALDHSGARIGAGGAIVAASDPAAEFDEMLLKADVIMQTIALASTGRIDAYRLSGPQAEPQPLPGAVPQSAPAREPALSAQPTVG